MEVKEVSEDNFDDMLVDSVEQEKETNEKPSVQEKKSEFEQSFF